MSLRAKFGTLLVVVFVLLASIISLLQVTWVNRLVINHTSEQMKQNINSAWQILIDQKKQLEITATFLSEKLKLRKFYLLSEEEIDALFDQYKDHWNLDILEIMDYNRIRMARLDFSASNPAIANPALSGFALVPEREFDLPQRPGTEPGQTIILFAAHPILDENDNPYGYLVAGMNLKGAHKIVDRIQGALFEDSFYKGKRVGTVTVFMGPERIATTVLLSSGVRAMGTLVSDEVAAQTLMRGVPWSGRAKVVDNWYLSRYDPIRDPLGNIIGMLYIGKLEQVSLDIKRNTLWTNISAILAVMAIAVLVSYWLSSRVLKQIDALEEGTKHFAKGKLHTRVDITTGDEVGDLASSFNKMAHIIEEDQNKLLKQKQEIEQINSNYMEMLGFVTHELRSTLSSAMFNVDLFKDGSYGELREDQIEGVDLIENSLAYLNELTNNYLQLSRIEKGELIINKISVNLLKDVINIVLQGLQRQIASRNMTVCINIPEDLTLPADMNLMRVVYENLIGNAIKFGKDNGRIGLEADILPNKAVLCVWNEGKSIDEERLTTLFRKFQRYDVDEKTGRQGSGLGLFIVKQIVTIHGGEVRVEAAEDRGTRFVFSLPR